MEVSLARSEPANIAPLLGRKRDVAVLLDCSLRHVDALIDDGEIAALLDGRIRKVVISSVHDYIARRLAAGDRRPLVGKPFGREAPDREETAVPARDEAPAA
jgi:excisionase family DNA binding protein